MIRRDPDTGAPTLLFRITVDRGIPWEMATHMLAQGRMDCTTSASTAEQSAAQSGWGGAGRNPYQLPPDVIDLEDDTPGAVVLFLRGIAHQRGLLGSLLPASLC